jgi:hypothetical protein
MLDMRRWSRRRTLLLAYAALMAVVVSCQIVAGVQSRSLNPIGVGCVLPSGSGPKVRVANLAPTTDLVDVCLRASGASSWGQPIFLNGGTTPTGLRPGCASDAGLGAAGLPYGQFGVTVAFSAPAATVDVKMIPGGSTCDAAALGEGDGLTLATNAVTTLALIGGNGVNETVIALPESDSTANLDRFRLVHAAPGAGPLEFGIVEQPHLPATLTDPFLSEPIPFGGTLPSGDMATVSAASVGDNGYVALITGTLYLGAALASGADGGSEPTDGGADGGTPSGAPAILVYDTSSQSRTSTLYVIGIEGNPTYPLRALVCDEDASEASSSSNPLLLPCDLSELSSISVDVFNPALFGANATDFENRKSLVPGAVAASTADIQCLVEVDFADDQTAIINAATTGAFPYNYTVSTNLSTPFSIATAQDGGTPPAMLAQPPCAGVSSDLINGALQCTEQYCSSEGPDAGGGVLNQSTDCIESNCAQEFLGIEQAPVPNGSACFDCIVVNVAGQTDFDSTYTSCTQSTQPPLGFGGFENSIILSRYPLNKTQAFILPSTFYRRSVLYASVQLEDQSVDFYCGFIQTTQNANALPYVGNYGNGATDSQTAWNNEQLYEAQLLVNWENSISGMNPAIVVGDWHSSIGVGPDAGTAPMGDFLPNDLNSQTLLFFNSQPGWSPVALAPGSGTAGWLPQCNDCPPPENPYNGPGDDYFFLQPYLVNWPKMNPVTSESLLYTQGVTPYDNDGAPNGPVSPYFGLNIGIVRPR